MKSFTRELKRGFVFFNFLCLFILGLSACGGGGGSSNGGGGSNTPTNTTLLSATLVTPTQGDTNVSRSLNIQFAFNQAVQGVNAQTVVLHENSAAGNTVELENVVSADNINYTFSLTNKLKSNASYYLVLGDVPSTENGITTYAAPHTRLSPATFNFTTGADSAPTVVIVSPTDKQTGVSIIPNIQIQFSTQVSGLNSQNVVLQDSNGTSIGLNGISSGTINNVYTFSPVNKLNKSSTYFLVIGAGTSPITEAANSEVKVAQTEFSFTTGANASPTVSLVRPASLSDVSVSQIFKLQFSKPVNNVNNSTIKIVDNAGVPVTLRDINPAEDNAYIFSPLDHLKGNTQYCLVVGNGITSQNTEDDPFQETKYCFETEDDTAPTVAIVSPVSTTNLPTNTQIELQFSEAVKGILQNNSSVVLYQGSLSGPAFNLGGSLSSTTDNIDYRFKTPKLLAGTAYYVVVGSSVVDMAGNPLTSITFKFTTTNSTFEWGVQDGSNGTTGVGISVGGNGTIYTAGYTSGAITDRSQRGLVDYFVTAYTNSGNLLWAKQVGVYGGTIIASGVSTDGAGNVYVVGSTDVDLPNARKTGGNNDFFITKYNSNGTLQWTKVAGGTGGTDFNTYATEIATDSSGNSYIVGKTNAQLFDKPKADSGFDSFIVKYDTNGNKIWDMQFQYPGTSQSNSISINLSNDAKYIHVSQRSGAFISYVDKFDSNGEEKWHTDVYNLSSSITSDANNNIYVYGQSYDYYGNISVLDKLDTDGNLIWERTPFTSGAEYMLGFSTGIVSDKLGNTYMGGYTSYPTYGQIQSGKIDYYITKFDTNGNFAGDVQVGGGGITEAKGYGITLDNNNQVYITGSTTGSLHNQPMVGLQDYFIAKYDGIVHQQN